MNFESGLSRAAKDRRRDRLVYTIRCEPLHTVERERERNKGGFLFASRIAEINVGIYIHIPRSNAGANDREKLRLERGDHREATAIKYCRERSARTSWLSPGFFCSTTPKETFFQTEDRFKYPLIRYSSRPGKEWEIRRARMAPLKASERGWLEEVRRERREGREKKANPRRRRRVAPRDSFCLRSSSSRFSRGVIRRVITTTNDAFTSI